MRSFVNIQMFSDLNQIEMEGERGKTGKIKDSFPGRLLRGLHVFLPLRSLMSNGFRIYFSRSTQTPESSRRRCSRERAPSNFEDHVPLRAQLSYWKSFDSRAVLEEPPLLPSTKLSIGFASTCRGFSATRNIRVIWFKAQEGGSSSKQRVSEVFFLIFSLEALRADGRPRSGAPRCS